ncbi:MAG TPA: pyridoxal-phosphate dependent enzyme [Chitinophagaceae bacterium]
MDTIQMPLHRQKEIDVAVLRLDKIHPLISGNKWFKLKYYLEDASMQQKKTIATFGGAYSNHILATAAVCKLKGLASIGIIRGEEPSVLSPTLLQARELGMHLFFISREDYAQKKIPSAITASDIYWINEGGYGEKGAQGASTITTCFDQHNYTHICCAVGTGTMMAGLITASLPLQTVIGISVLKNNLEIMNSVKPLLPEEKNNFHVFHDYHFGGYAKHKTELIRFMNEFYTHTMIPSDFVYTGKLFYAINDLVEKNYFPSGSNVLIVHSGGLQGNVSLSKGTLIF